MNILEEKLVNISKDSNAEGDAIVQDVKLLLADTASEERQVLRSIGLSFDLNLAESKLQDQIIKKTNSDKLGRVVVTGEDIKKMCTDYRLYMKPASRYTGTIPPTLGAELTRFCKEKNIPLTAYADHSKFFIIAPPKMFSGYKSPMNVFNETMREMEEERAEMRRLREEDPILVYKLEDGYYAIIKSWGDDFSWLRRIYGWMTSRKNIGKMVYLFNAILFWSTLYGVYKLNIFAAVWHNPYKEDHWSPNWYIAISAIASIVALVHIGIYLWNDESGSYLRARKKLIEKVTEYEKNARY